MEGSMSSNTVLKISDASGRILVLGRQKTNKVEYVFSRYNDMTEADKKAVRTVFELVAKEGVSPADSDGGTDIDDINRFLNFEDQKPKLCG